MWSLCPWVQTTATTRRPPTAARIGVGVVGGVDDEHLGVVTDQPDVVLDLPRAAVELEDPGGDDPLDPDAARRRGHRHPDVGHCASP